MIAKEAFFNLQYGLFLLSTNDEDRDNVSVINTVMQITDNPKRIVIGINKSSYNCEIIEKTGAFNISVLTEKTPFDVFKQFGFVSGREKDKTAGMALKRSENGIVYFDDYANSFISASVTEKVDCGTHFLFIADVTEAVVLSNENSVTYEYYHKNIKVVPEQKKEKGYVCKICGYVYEGEVLPDDFVCPWCKHGADDFVEMK